MENRKWIKKWVAKYDFAVTPLDGISFVNFAAHLLYWTMIALLNVILNPFYIISKKNRWNSLIEIARSEVPIPQNSPDRPTCLIVNLSIFAFIQWCNSYAPLTYKLLKCSWCDDKYQEIQNILETVLQRSMTVMLIWNLSPLRGNNRWEQVATYNAVYNDSKLNFLIGKPGYMFSIIPDVWPENWSLIFTKTSE